MNRFYNQFYYSLEKGKCSLYGNAEIGASGATTISAVKSKGIASITRGGSAGLYTVTLQDKYVDLFMLHASFIKSSDPGVAYVYIVSQDVAGAKTVVFQCADASGAAVDPASGSTMMIELVLKTSTAQ